MDFPAVRPVQVVIITPYYKAEEVVLYKDTYELHILQNHSEVTQEMIVQTLSAPTVICEGTDNKGYITFVNSDLISSTSKSPFAVFVDGNGNPKPVVASAAFRRDFIDTSKHTVLWLPQK